jgi:5-methylcytosine-specific restriction endonuclease McrA
MLAEAVINALARISKRQLIASEKEGESCHIPQEVKIAVWQRDQGRCVQCGDNSYLEFDHIIPFSKGGASTVGNVQLLCRRCNLGKGDRI